MVEMNPLYVFALIENELTCLCVCMRERDRDRERKSIYLSLIFFYHAEMIILFLCPEIEDRGLHQDLESFYPYRCYGAQHKLRQLDNVFCGERRTSPCKTWKRRFS